MRLIIFIISLLFTVSIYAQKTDTIFNGYLSPIVRSGGTAPNFNFRGIFRNKTLSSNGFDTTGISLEIMTSSDGNCYRLPVTSISTISNPVINNTTIEGTVTDVSSELATIPSGVAAIYTKTDSLGLIPDIEGLTEDLKTCIFNYNIKRIESVQAGTAVSNSFVRNDSVFITTPDGDFFTGINSGSGSGITAQTLADSMSVVRDSLTAIRNDIGSGGTDDQTAAEVSYTNNGQTTVEGGLDSLFNRPVGIDTLSTLADTSTANTSIGQLVYVNSVDQYWHVKADGFFYQLETGGSETVLYNSSGQVVQNGDTIPTVGYVDAAQAAAESFASSLAFSSGSFTTIDTTVQSDYTVSVFNTARITSFADAGVDNTISLPTPVDSIKGNVIEITHLDTSASQGRTTTVETDGTSYHLYDNLTGDTLTFFNIYQSGQTVRFTLQEVEGVLRWVAVNLSPFVYGDKELTAVGQVRQDVEGQINWYNTEYNREYQANQKPDVFRLFSDTTLSVINNDKRININFNKPAYNDTRITGVFDHRLVVSSYTGPAYTVENSAGDTLQINYLSGSFGSLPDTAAILAFDDTVYVKRWYNQKEGPDFEVGSTSVTGRGPLIVLNGTLIKENGQLAIEYIRDGSTLEVSSEIWGDSPSSIFLQSIQNWSSNFAAPSGNTTSPTNFGVHFYNVGSQITVEASGYDRIIGESAGYYQLNSLMPRNQQLFNSFLLRTDTVLSYKDGNLVTPDSIYTGSLAGGFIGLMLGRVDNNAFSSFWYYDGKFQQLIISGQDISDIRQEIYTETSKFYNSSIVDQTVTSNQINIQLQAANSSNQGFEVQINSTGQDGTIQFTGSQFLNRNSLSDTLTLQATGNPVIMLSSVVYQDSFAWKVNYPIVDNAVLDTIANRLYSSFVYVSQEASLQAAIDSASTLEKILVVDDSIRAVGTVNLLDLNVIFTKKGKLNADTITASGAYFNEAPRQLFGNNTIVLGEWNCNKSYVEWTVGNALSNSLSNWRGFRNAIYFSNNINLLSKEYRLSGSVANQYTGEKQINITGKGADSTVLILTGTSRYIYATGTSKGAPISIQDVTFKTSDYENGLFNQNRGFIFAAVQRTSGNENVYTDFSKVEIRNCNFFGEVQFRYSIEGSAASFPDSVSFSTSGIDFVTIENCQFDAVRDFFSMGNTLARRAVVRNNIIENLSGIFISQGSTLPDSLGGGYDLAEFIFEKNLVQNDSIIEYFGGGYMTPLSVKANKVRFEGNTLKNIAKYNNGADVHICYPSAEQFWLVNNYIENVTEFTGAETGADGNSLIKFKGAQQAYIIGNTIKISQDKLIEYNILDTNLNLLLPEYRMALISKEGQNFYQKGITMHNNTFDIPVLNVSTQIRDNSKFDIQNNTFNIGRFADEPASGTEGNTLPFHFFYANQGAAVRDTVSSIVSKGNVFNIGVVDSNYITYMNWASLSDPEGTQRLTPLVHFEDEWNVNNVDIRYYPYNSKRYINRSKLNGSGAIKNFANKNITPKYEFDEGVINVVVRESVGNNMSTPVFPAVPHLQGKYTVLENSSDRLRLMEGDQSDWSNGWLEDKDSVIVTYRVDYTDTLGVDNQATWKVRYGRDVITKTWFYQDGVEISIDPSIPDTNLVDANINIPIELRVGGNIMDANLYGLNVAKSYTVYCNIESNTNASIAPVGNIYGDVDTLQTQAQQFEANYTFTPFAYNAVDTIPVDTLLSQRFVVTGALNSKTITGIEYTLDSQVTTRSTLVRLLKYTPSTDTYVAFGSASLTVGNSFVTNTPSQTISQGDIIYAEVSQAGDNISGLTVSLKIE